MAWYRTGTVQLTKGSTTVTGNGTNFTDSAAGVNPGDMLMAGGAFMEVAGVNSATTLTLAVPSDVTVPAGSPFIIVTSFQMSNSSLSKKVAAAMDRILQSIANWMTLLTQTGNVTITPYGSDVSYSGRSWKEMNTQIDNNATATNGKLAKASNLSDVADAAKSRTNLGVAYGTDAGTVAQGNDARLSTVDGKSGGTINGNVNIEGTVVNFRSNTPSGGWPFLLRFLAGQGNNVPYAQINQEQSGQLTISTNLSGTARYFAFKTNGGLDVPGTVTCTSVVQTSDRNKKENIVKIENALDKVEKLNGYTFDYIDGKIESAGVIAQELQEVLPEVVKKNVVRTPVRDEIGLPTGEFDEDTYLSVDYSGPVALLIEAVKDLNGKISKQDLIISELQKRMKAIDGLDA